MEDNKMINKLNVWKHRTFYSFGSTIVFALAIGLSVGFESVFPNVFLYNISVVSSITTGVSLGTFIFSAIKQFKYQELVDNLTEQDTPKENAPALEPDEVCQILMSNTQHIDSVRQIDEPTDLSNNRVLQLTRKNFKQ